MQPSLPMQTKSTTNQSVLFVTVLLFFDSLHYVFGRELHLYISPNVSAMYVMIISTAEIAIYALVTRQLDWRVLRRHLWFFLAIGFLIGVATNLGYTALGFVDPGTASMLGKIGTIFTIGFGMVWLRERFTPMQWLGALIAIVGSFVIAYQPGNYLQIGSLLILLETLLYALHTALVKRYGGDIDFVNFFFFRLLSTATILFVIAVGTNSLAWPSGSAWRWLLVTATVERMVAGPQADLVIAPGFEPGVIDALRARRKNTRILEAPAPGTETLDIRQISGGFLVQAPRHFAATRNDWRVVTKVAPTPEQWRDIELAWRIGGHVKSNSIVLVKDGQAVGIGAGQQNRVESGLIAAQKAAGRARGGAAASDAFYPFEDGIEAAADAGVAAVIQPGGALRDEKIIERADELGLAMVFTGERHFLH